MTERQDGVRKEERLYVGDFERLREFAGAGAEVSLARETLHVMDDRQRIALVETRTVDSDDALLTPAPLQRFQLNNHLGSACLELDEAAGLIAYEEYTPYGSPAYQAGRSAPEVSLRRYRYTGKERDPENGFTYHGARYYAPWLGRWTSCDPIGISDGLNLYRYGRNNPNGFIDPSGRDTVLNLITEDMRAQREEDMKNRLDAEANEPLDHFTQDEHRAMGLGGAFVESGTTGVLDYLHAEANTRPDAGVEPTELPPGGTDWSAGGEGGMLSDPAMRTATGIAVDIMIGEALGEGLGARRPGGVPKLEKPTVGGGPKDWRDFRQAAADRQAASGQSTATTRISSPPQTSRPQRRTPVPPLLLRSIRPRPQRRYRTNGAQRESPGHRRRTKSSPMN